MLLVNSCVFLALKSKLCSSLGTGLKTFKLIVGSLHISYTKYVKSFFKVYGQGKRLPLFSWWHGRGGILKNVTNGDISGRGNFRGVVIFEWSQRHINGKKDLFPMIFEEYFGNSNVSEKNKVHLDDFYEINFMRSIAVSVKV